MLTLHHECKPDFSKSSSTESSYLLTPFERKLLLEKLQTDLRPEYRRRIEIMLLADLGQSQAQICEALHCSHETARYWISMAQTGQAHTWNDLPIGRPKTISDEYIERLRELVSCGPQEYGYSFRRWTAQWLSKHLAREFGIEVSDRHINRLLKKMGLSTRKQSSRTKKAANLPETQSCRIVIGNLPSVSPPVLTNTVPFKPNQELQLKLSG